MNSPGKDKRSAGALFEELVSIVARLRDPQGGCPWDLEQTHQTLKPHAVEEAYEVCDAIDNSPAKLPEELGDLLLQVVLHAQLGREAGTFDIDRVIAEISSKLVRRHPHVFGELKVEGAQEVLKNWERIKKEEKKAGTGLLEDLPKSLPALYKAHRIGEKVARVNFDWPDTMEVEAKVEEELREFLECSRQSQRDVERLAEEFGDLLFTLAQLARKMGLNSEDLLARANNKFCRRFQRLEELAGCDMKDLGPQRLEELWGQVKQEQKAQP